MSSARMNPSHLYGNVASLWMSAGASSPLDGVEAMLELIALEGGDAGEDILSGDRELTRHAWEQARKRLSKRLHLPEPSDRGRYLVDHSPGLIEQTRRFVSAIRTMTPKAASDFYAAYVHFLAHAPQTGLRRTEIGHSTWPDYLEALFKALIPRGAGTVYVPFDSAGWLPLLLAADGVDVACELRSPQIARIFGLFAHLGRWKLRINLGDALRHPTYLDGQKLRRFPSSATVLTFGLRDRDEREPDPHNRFPMRLIYGEGRQLAHMLAQTEGTVLAVAPEAFLFRSTGGERDFKEYLVRRGILSTVIRLPKSTFFPSASVQCSLLILNASASRERNVLMLDATSDLGSKSPNARHEAVQQIASLVSRRKAGPEAALVDYDEIAANDFNLSVDRYVRSDEEQQIAHLLESAQTVALGDMVEIIRPQSFPSDGTPPVQTFAEVGLQDIGPDGTISIPAKRVEIDDHSLAKVLRQKLEQNDVLLSVRGRIGTVGLFDGTGDDEFLGWLASQAFVILRPRDTSPVTPLALLRYLASPIAQTTLRSLSTGATVPMISMGDIKKLRIMVPTREDQSRIEQEHQRLSALRREMAELQTRVDQLAAEAWPMSHQGNGSRSGRRADA